MLLQKNIIRKYTELLDSSKVEASWLQYQGYFLNKDIQQNIRQSKEEQFQEGFLRELFVKVLGYTLNPSPGRLSENIEGIKVTTALQTFDRLSFAEFIKELKKQKIKLSLSQQDEWEDYFNDYAQACQQLSAQIAQTDSEIDARVSALYGLTPEEQDIIKNR